MRPPVLIHYACRRCGGRRTTDSREFARKAVCERCLERQKMPASRPAEV